jgi:hypothetical protein
MYAKKSYLLWCLFLSAILMPAVSAAEVERLAPTTFTRTTGKPNIFTVTFAAVPGAGNIHVMNGSPEGRRKVHSGSVRLNGQVLLGPQGLVRDPDRREHDFTVQLLEQNTLIVELASASDSFLVVGVTQTEIGPTALVTGVVRNRNTGTPIANAIVSLNSSGGGSQVTADAQGRYVITVQDLSSINPGAASALNATAIGYFESAAVALDFANTPTLPLIQDLTLLPGGIVIQGTVRNLITAAPIPNAHIGIYGGGFGTVHGVDVVTDNNGSYSVDSHFFAEWALASGFNLWINVYLEGFFGASRDVNFVNYPVVQDFDLFMASGPLITGTVRDRVTGNPIAGATVLGGARPVFTDDQGQYTVDASDFGSFSTSGALWGTAPGYFEGGFVFFDLTAAPSLPLVRDLTLLPGGSIIQGVVRDTVTGAPLPGARVAMYGGPFGMAHGVEVVTDGDGKYSVDSHFFAESAATSGVYLFINVYREGYLGVFRDVSFTQYPNVQDFSLLSSSGPLITGTVRDRQTGQPVAGATVFFFGRGIVISDAQGHYAFTGADLTSGSGVSGVLAATAHGYFEGGAVFVDLNSAPSLPLLQDISILPGGTVVRGVVRDAATGVGIPGVHVGVYGSGFGAAVHGVDAITDQNGSYYVDSSYFAEWAFSSGFSLSLYVNADGYFGTFRDVSFSSIPNLEDFSLTPIP